MTDKSSLRKIDDVESPENAVGPRKENHLEHGVALPTSNDLCEEEGQTNALGKINDNEQSEKARSEVKWMTTKRDFRARAHSNPLNDGLFTPPLDADTYAMTMNERYINPPSEQIHWCDIGCGYGGLLASLSKEYPHKITLGLEIRDRVAEFCRQRVLTLRTEHPGRYGNVWFERTNAMKFLPHYLKKGSVEKLFFCYPDPHFKRRKNRQRVISSQLLAEYAYVLREGEGIAYIVTDVEELFTWMVDRFENHPLFERRSNDQHRQDAVSTFVRDFTDEAQRVERSDRSKFDASFRRIPNPVLT